MNRHAFLACAALFAAAPAFAAASHPRAQPVAAAARADAPAPVSAVGVVRSVDVAQGKVTVRHEPIASLGWPAMTMAFRVADAKLLPSLTPGKKVRFAFVQEGTSYVITAVE